MSRFPVPFRAPTRARTAAVVTAAALVLTPLATAPAASAAAPPDGVLLSVDFEDGTAGALLASGGGARSVVDVDGSKAYLVSGRTQSYDGLETPTGLLDGLAPGTVVTVSMKARLAEGTAGGYSARWVSKPSYGWIGNAELSSAAWTTLSGTYTVPATGAETSFYTGTGPDSGAEFSYLLDDVTVSVPPSEPEITTFVATDFEDDSWQGDWSQSGATTLSVVDDGDGGHALHVADRAADYVGIQTVAGTFAEMVPGETYDFSARVRLEDGTAGSAGVRLVMKPMYAWIGNTTMTADGWTQIDATWTVPADATPADLQLYVGTGAVAGVESYGYLVDDISVTGQAGGDDGDYVETDPDFVPGGAVAPTQTPVVEARGSGKTAALTFDDGPNGATTIELLDFLKANDVTATFCVIGQNITAEGGADVLRRIVGDGHTLCNHSTDYASMDTLTPSAAAAKMKQNLATIRTALNDPFAEVPYFRAPNGAWGRTPQPAVALGMQPLAVANLVFDWDGAENAGDEAKLTDALRTTITEHPGQIVLVHDGGGDRSAGVAAVKTVVAELLADGWTFTLPQGGAAPKGQTLVASDFEDGTLQGWTSRDLGENGAAELTVADVAHTGDHSARISGRTSQGHGPQYDVVGSAVAGASYDVDAWVRFEDTPGDMTLSAHTRSGGTDTYSNLVAFTGLSASQWVHLTGTFTMPAFDEAAELYLETTWANGEAGNISPFLVDDIVVRSTPVSVIEDVTPLQDTIDVPLGVAIDSRETSGTASQLLLKHFGQVTSENYMKPEAWYDAERTFRRHPEATALMDFALENDLRVYGHTLVWHSQTPAWFFQDDEGRELTSSEADQEILRQRLQEHVEAVAADLAAEYGPFGSDGNPIVAFDVVNEVVDDGTAYADGMRRSRWYQVLGEQFVDLAFQYADEAFNGTHAAEGSDRPVTLFINDYNTEQSGKRSRLHALVERLLDRGVPVDGVGHQLHVALSTPVSTVDAAIDAFEDLPVVQAVTELDVQVGSADQAKAIDQGYYYRDAFRIFREHADDLFSVTVWGLTDGRSWRAANNGKPLLFDDRFQAKPAYFGAADGELPAAVRSALAFGRGADGDDSAGSVRWKALPLHAIGENAGFQLRWAPDGLTVYVDVTDATVDATDAVVLETPEGAFAFGRDGEGDLEGTATERDGGWTAVVELPLADAARGDVLELDVRVVDGAGTAGWNTPGVLGSVSLAEPISYTEVPQAPVAPAVDGDVDAVWASGGSVRTAKETTGTGGAQADVSTLWKDGTLYVLMDVADPVVDTTGSDPWTQDSVEIYVDSGNHKNGSYRYDDTQIRVNADGLVSFGAGDEAFQRNRLQSAVVRTATGYRVEAAISLLEDGGLGTFHGLDLQVNDAAGGSRSAITNWSDPTNAGYQSTAHWGVARLVGPSAPVQVAPVITQQPQASVTGALGSTVTLTAAASGTPEPTAAWSWRKRGTTTWLPLAGTSASRSVLLNATTDGSSYRVTFTNSAGSVTSQVSTVHVKHTAPVVTLHPASVTSAKFTTVTLKAAATGYPTPKVVWQRKDAGSSTWRTLTTATSTSLRVVVWSGTDGDRYRAVFSNDAGKATTSAATVTMKHIAPKITAQPQDRSVLRGATATFTVAGTGYPAPSVQWYERRAGTSTWVAIPGATGTRLAVVATQARHYASYKAVLRNDAGWASSVGARLTVR